MQQLIWMWINVGGKDTLKKLLRVLLRIILTPSICCGNTSGRKTVRSKTFTYMNCAVIIWLFPTSDSEWFQKCSWTKTVVALMKEDVGFYDTLKNAVCITNTIASILFSRYSLLHGCHHLTIVCTPSFFTHIFSQTYLCSSCGESESCLGWVSGHLSSPSVADCPSEQGVRPSEKEGGL